MILGQQLQEFSIQIQLMLPFLQRYSDELMSGSQETSVAAKNIIECLEATARVATTAVKNVKDTSADSQQK